MAEGGDGAVVVGARAFAEGVGQPVDEDRGTRAARVFEGGLFRGALALAIGVVERGLDGGAEDERRRVVVAFEGQGEVARQVAVARHEVGRVRGTVHAGEVKGEVARLGKAIEVSGIAVAVKGEDSVVRTARAQVMDEIGADEAGRAGDEDVHRRASNRRSASWT